MRARRGSGRAVAAERRAVPGRRRAPRPTRPRMRLTACRRRRVPFPGETGADVDEGTSCRRGASSCVNARSAQRRQSIAWCAFMTPGLLRVGDDAGVGRLGPGVRLTGRTVRSRDGAGLPGARQGRPEAVAEPVDPRRVRVEANRPSHHVVPRRRAHSHRPRALVALRSPVTNAKAMLAAERLGRRAAHAWWLERGIWPRCPFRKSGPDLYLAWVHGALSEAGFRR